MILLKKEKYWYWIFTRPFECESEERLTNKKENKIDDKWRKKTKKLMKRNSFKENLKVWVSKIICNKSGG